MIFLVTLPRSLRGVLPDSTFRSSAFRCGRLSRTIAPCRQTLSTAIRRSRHVAMPAAASARCEQSASARRRAKLLGLGLEHVVQAVFGKLDAGREPEAVAADLPHVMQDAAQRERAARP